MSHKFGVPLCEQIKRIKRQIVKSARHPMITKDIGNQHIIVNFIIGEYGDTIGAGPGVPYIHFTYTNRCASHMVTLISAGTVNS